MTRWVVGAAMLALVACGGSERPRTQSTKPPIVRVYGEGLTLYPGRDNAVRIGFDPAEATADLIATFRPDTARIAVCPLEAIDTPLPPAARCRSDARSGVRDVVAAPALRGIALVLDHDDVVPVDVVLEYPERSRSIALRMPRLTVRGGPACADNACSPFFEAQPLRSGSFTATAGWRGADASLVMLQGRVLARAQTSSGFRYARAAEARGASPLSLATRLAEPGEYALAFGTGDESSPVPVEITDLSIDARWP